MKTLHKINLSILCGFAAAMVGCGGGGGSGGGEEEATSTLDEQAVETMASHLIVNAICVAVDTGTSSSTVQSSSSAESASHSSETVSSDSSGTSSSTAPVSSSSNNSSSNSSSSSTASVGSMSSGSSSSFNPFPVHSRAYEYDQTFNGTLGGTLDVHTYHNDGTTTLTFSMDDFTNLLFGKAVGLLGTFETVDHGTPSDYGPIVTNKTAETKGAIDGTVDDAARAETAASRFTFELIGYNQVYATEYAQPDTLTLTSAVLTNKDADKVFSVKNASADAVVTYSQALVSNISATYTDADVGTVKVSQESEVITVDLTDMYGGIPVPTYVKGGVELTATDGTKAGVEINGTELIFSTIDENGNKTVVKTLECQNLLPTQ